MYYLLYCILIFSIIFQDLPGSDALGTYGRVLTLILTPVIFLIYFIMTKKISINENIKKFIKLIIYLFIINVISIAVMYLFMSGNLYSSGEFLPLKTIKGYTFILINVMFLILMYNMQKGLNKEKVFYPFYITYIILFIILLIELYNPNLLSIFHSSNQIYYRIRLLTSESSFTSLLIILFFVPSFYYTMYIKNSKVRSIILIITLIIFILTTGSKGLIISLIISLFILVMISKLKIKTRMLILGVVIIMCVILGPKILTSISNDIENYTSVATRVYTICTAIAVSVIYPFGIGNGLYLVIYKQFLSNHLNLLNQFGLKLNNTEILSMINSNNDYNLAAKSGVFQYGIYWGIVGTVYFIKILKDIFIDLKKIHDRKLIIFELGMIFLIINIVFIINFDVQFEVFAYLSLMVYISDINKYKGIKEGVKNNESINNLTEL